MDKKWQYVLEPETGTVHLGVPSEPDEACYLALRVARTLILQQLGAIGWTFLHAACAVSPAGSGVLITGPKKAGKTTTLLSLVAHGFRFMANDKTAIRRTNGDIEGIGFPIRSGIRRGALRAFPAVAWAGDPRSPSVRDDDAKTYVPPQAVARALNSIVQPKATIELIVAPRWQSQLQAPVLQPIGNDEAIGILREQHLATLAAVSPEQHFLDQLMPDAFGPDSSHADETLTSLAAKPFYRLDQSEIGGGITPDLVAKQLEAAETQRKAS